MKVAVVAHAGKTLGGGLPELRRVLADRGHRRPALVRGAEGQEGARRRCERALEEGAELVFAWGGDGMVRRCVGVLAGADGRARGPARRDANLFATNLGIPSGHRAGGARSGCAASARRIDVGRFNGERFAVMAGAGFDAAMIRDADDLKERLGRAAYVCSGAREPAAPSRSSAQIEVDGADVVRRAGDAASWSATSARSSAASRSSPTRGPTTGCSSSASSTAEGLVQWTRDARPHRGRRPADVAVRPRDEGAQRVKVKLDRKVRYELDGGDRSKVKTFKVEVEPGALRVRVPQACVRRRS